MNLTLIGMPASGKSKVGAVLAGHLGWELIDPDKLIEADHGKPLQQILDELGDDAFMRTEAETVIKATRDREGLIISPGGSIVYSPDAMQHLREISTIVYLWLPLPVVEERVAKSPPRGIVHGDRTVQQLYAERTPLYEEWANAVVREYEDTQKRLREILDVLGLP